MADTASGNSIPQETGDNLSAEGMDRGAVILNQIPLTRRISDTLKQYAESNAKLLRERLKKLLSLSPSLAAALKSESDPKVLTDDERKVAEALKELSLTPEGEKLVSTLDSYKIPVNLTSANDEGALNKTQIAMGSILAELPRSIDAPGAATPGGLTAVLAHELEHLRQTQKFVSSAYNGNVPPPEDVLRLNSFVEADAQATATEIAYKLKQQGKPAAWDSIVDDTQWTSSIAKAYAAAAEKDPGAVATGIAKRAAFDTWFTATFPETGTEVAHKYYEQGFDRWFHAGVERLMKAGAVPEPLDRSAYLNIGGLSDVNYLDLPQGRPLDDPLYGIRAQGQAVNTLKVAQAQYEQLKQDYALRVRDGLPPEHRDLFGAPREPAAETGTTTFEYGTSEANLTGALDGAIQPRYRSARDKVRDIVKNALPEGADIEAGVDKALANGAVHTGAHKSGGASHVASTPAGAENYALGEAAAETELASRVYLALGVSQPRLAPRPVRVTLEAADNGDAQLREGGNLKVKSVTFARMNDGRWTFKGQAALAPDVARSLIQPMYAAAGAAATEDAARQAVLKELNDFGTEPVRAQVTGRDGRPRSVFIPDIQFVPAVGKKVGYLGVETTKYKMPFDLTPVEANNYFNILDAETLSGKMVPEQKAAKLSTFFAEMERVNPQLKDIAFDRNNPKKVSDAVYGVLNEITPADMRFHLGDAPRPPGYSRGHVWEMEWDFAPETLQKVNDRLAAPREPGPITAGANTGVAANTGENAPRDMPSEPASPETASQEPSSSGLAQRVQRMWSSSWQNAKVGLLSQLPVIGPHGTGETEAELLLTGKKPFGWIPVVPDNVDPFAPENRRMIAMEQKLDAAVKEGKLKAVDVVIKRKSPDGTRTFESTTRHYAQPGNEDVLNTVSAYNEKLWNGQTPDAQLSKDFGDYLGYRPRDQALWNGLQKYQQYIPRSWVNTLYNFNRNFSQPAYLESELGHPVRKQQTLFEGAAGGDAAKQLQLGNAFQYGFDRMPKDPARAMEWIGRSAAQGYAPAQYELGRQYSIGDFTPRNAVEAEKWLSRSAEQGYPWAMTSLGHLVQEGNGIPQDDARALDLFRRAAELGDVGAQAAIGDRYATGRGVPKDNVEAGFWYKLARQTVPDFPAGGEVLTGLTPEQTQAIDGRVAEWKANHLSQKARLQAQFKEGAPVELPMKHVTDAAFSQPVPTATVPADPATKYLYDLNQRIKLGTDVAFSASARKLLVENSNGFLNTLDPTSKLRLVMALDTLSKTPDGKRLVDQFIDSGATLKLKPSQTMQGASGTFWPKYSVQPEGYLETIPFRINAAGELEDGKLVATLAHELEHLNQASSRNMTPLSFGKIPTPDDIILHNRFIEADAQATATEIAWQLKQQGKPETWNALQTRTSDRQIAQAYEAAVVANPAAAEQGYAKRAAFDRWFTSSSDGSKTLTTWYDQSAVDHWPSEPLIEDMLKNGAKPEPLTLDDYKRLGQQPNGVNYLDLPGAKPLDDPQYAQKALSVESAETLARNKAKYAAIQEGYARGEKFVASGENPQKPPLEETPWDEKPTPRTPGTEAFDGLVQGYGRLQGFMRAIPENIRIAANTPSALVTAIPYVQQRRVNRALDAIRAIPEGKELADLAREKDIKFNLTADPLVRGGALNTWESVMDGKVNVLPDSIRLQGFSTEGTLTMQMLHELVHLRQANTGIASAFQGQLRTPEDAVLFNRFKEADAEATATDLAYKLKQAGNPAAWNAIRDAQGMPPEISAAYEKMAASDPAALTDGRAKRAAFDAWFTAKMANGQSIPNFYNDQAFQSYPNNDNLTKVVNAGGEAAPLTPEELKKFGAASGVNYLDIPGGKPLTDPLYTTPDMNARQQGRLSVLKESFNKASQRGEVVTLNHGTSEAYLKSILENGFQPRYRGAREKVRGMLNGALPEGADMEATVTKVLDESSTVRHRAHEVSDILYTTSNRQLAENYASLEAKSGGEMGRQAQSAAGVDMIGKPTLDARPVRLELEAPSRDVLRKGDERFRKMDGGRLTVDSIHEVLLKADKDIAVKSVTFARWEGDHWTFDGQPELTPEQAMKEINPKYAAARTPAPVDEGRRSILKEIHDFETGPGVDIVVHGTTYSAQVERTDAQGRRYLVHVPDTDFVPAAEEKLGKYFKDVSQPYKMPYDLTPIEMDAYLNVLDAKSATGALTAEDKATKLGNLFQEMERINPELKTVAFDRSNPVKVADAVRGTVNSIKPEDITYHLSDAPRPANYDKMRGHTAGMDWDFTPKTLQSVSDQIQQKTEEYMRRNPAAAAKSGSGVAAEQLKDYYLIRGFRKDADPFSSIMDLPKDEAIRLMEERDGFRGTGEADQFGRRDQKVYYGDRANTDSWLRENATASMNRENPVFFTLTNDPETLKKVMASPGKDLMVVPVKDLDLSKWSFTFDDSMGNYFQQKGEPGKTGNFLQDNHELHGTVLDANGVAAAVTKYGTALPDGTPREIEAQYWGPAFDPKAAGGYVAEGVPNPYERLPQTTRDIAALWRQNPVTDLLWQPVEDLKAAGLPDITGDGHTRPHWVSTEFEGKTVYAVAKPLDKSGYDRSAAILRLSTGNETPVMDKIAFDMAYDAGVPVAPAALWKNPEGEKFVLSLKPYDNVATLADLGGRDFSPGEGQMQLAQSLREVSSVSAFNLFAGQSDDHSRNILFDRDNPSLPPVFIDYDMAFQKEVLDNGRPRISGMADFFEEPVKGNIDNVLRAVDVKSVQATAERIMDMDTGGRERIVTRIPDEFLGEQQKNRVLNYMDYAAETFPDRIEKRFGGAYADESWPKIVTASTQKQLPLEMWRLLPYDRVDGEIGSPHPAVGTELTRLPEPKAEAVQPPPEKTWNDAADKQRIAAALDTLSSVPEGERLVKVLRDANIPVVFAENPDIQENGRIISMRDKIEGGRQVTEPVAIVLKPGLSDGQMVHVLSHELRHLDQIQTGMHSPYQQGVIASPMEVMANNRRVEADAQATATEIAWQLKEQGKPEAWQALRDNTSAHGNIAEAYARAASNDPEAVKNGAAKAAAFEEWFKTNLQDTYSHQAVNSVLGENGQKQMLEQGARVEMLTRENSPLLREYPDNARYMGFMGALKPEDEAAFEKANGVHAQLKNAFNEAAAKKPPAGEALKTTVEAEVPAKVATETPPEVKVNPKPVEAKVAAGDATSKFMKPKTGKAPVKTPVVPEVLNGGVGSAGAGAIGLVMSAQGMVDAYKTGDKTEMAVAGTNMAISAVQTGEGIVTAAGYSSPILKGAAKFVPGVNIGVTLVDGAYQISKEKTTEHKVERGVVVGATAATGFIVGTATASAAEAATITAAVTATFGTGAIATGAAAVVVAAAPVVLTVAAVGAVAYVGNKAIEARRAWADTEREMAENAKPQKRQGYKSADGKPSILAYKHIAVEMLRTSGDIKDANLSSKPARDKNGHILIDEIKKLDMHDPKNIAELERVLDQNIKKQQEVMKQNDSILPRWMRSSDSADKYTNAQMALGDLTGAKAELDMYKKELQDYNASQTTKTQDTSRVVAAKKTPKPGMVSG